MRYFALFVVCLLLCSCASVLDIKYDEQGRIDLIKAKGAQQSSIKQGDIEVKMNNKAEPLKDIINLNLAKVGD